MDKEFMLKYLKEEHLQNNAELYEVAEISGLEVVKQLFRNHETMRMCYIPQLNNNECLLTEIVSDNIDMPTGQLAALTGCTRNRIDNLKEKINK